MLLTVRWPLCPPREPVTMFAHREHTVVFWTLLLQQPRWGGGVYCDQSARGIAAPSIKHVSNPSSCEVYSNTESTVTFK